MQAAVMQRLMESHLGNGGRTRDQELVRYVGRHGVVSIDHVMKAMGIGRTAAYRRVAGCAEAGLLERLDLLRSEPTVLRATREGLRYGGLGLSVATVSPAELVHRLRCVSAADAAGQHYGHERILTERELILAEAIEEAPIASARLGEYPNGTKRWHRPDLAILSEDGVIAVEVELTAKSSRRLEAIMRAWRRARWVAEVHYLCAPGQTHRAVERAIETTGAGRKVRAVSKASR